MCCTACRGCHEERERRGRAIPLVFSRAKCVKFHGVTYLCVGPMWAQELILGVLDMPEHIVSPWCLRLGLKRPF